MRFEFEPTSIPDVILIKPRVFTDERGFFAEFYRSSEFMQAGIGEEFVQDNISRSVKGILRGLHYQIERQQAKLVFCPHGKIFDVAVDLRRGSPTYGYYASAELSSDNLHMLYIPEGFAHGFCVLSDEAFFTYKCSNYYYPEGERGIRWDDPEIAINWPLDEPTLSEKDQKLPKLEDMDNMDLPLLEDHHP